MAKSKYAEQLNQGKPILDTILDEQIGRLARSPAQDRKSLLRDWEDLAGAETGVKDRYRGRYMFELLQNANDAIVEAEESNGLFVNEHHLVRLELTERALLVANYGQPFAENNVRSLCRLHKTTKHSINKQIGHKGIGFKSVLEICQRPEVYSDLYAFGYDGEQFRHDVVNVVGKSWHGNLPILRAPYPRHINQLPPEDRERIETLFEDGYVTVIRLPLDDPALVDDVAKRLESDITPQLLLFLTAITQIEISFPDGREVVFYRPPYIHQPVADQPLLSLVILRRNDENGDALDSRWLVLGPVECPVTNRSLVEELENEAWREVTALRFSLLFPLDNEVKKVRAVTSSFPFHVYFPTEEPSGLRFIVHGDFYIGDDRKTIPLNSLNRWLMEEICAYLAGEGAEALKQYWGHNEILVDLLAPLNQPERDFARVFMQKYTGYLRLAPFVPIDGGQYKTPDTVRLPPLHVNEILFRRLFPAARLRQDKKWAYPIAGVIETERRRTSPFLLSPQLGGQEVDPVIVIASLERDGMPPLSESAELITFLAEWYDRLPHNQRQEFLGLIRNVSVLPTVSGWRTPGEGIVFQANMRLDVADFQVPAGFEFSVIRRAVYPEQGTRSPEYKLFTDLGARPYSIRDILRDAVLSILVNEKRFSDLQSREPEAIYGAYRLLKVYFQEDGATTDRIGELLPRVPVPSIDCHGQQGWQMANQCYFGQSWPEGKILTTLFGNFEDCYLLSEIPLLISEESERQEWFSFFRWLGVMDHPRLVEVGRKLTHNQKPLGKDLSLWVEYKQRYNAHFKCQHPTKDHKFSRWMGPVYTLHHFDELVAEGNGEKLLSLYDILGRHWADYRSHSQTTLSCKYTSYDCPKEEVENYFLFALRQANWLPAQVDDTWTSPLPPQHIWLMGETDPADVRRLVPTLPGEWRSGHLRDFASDLKFVSSGTAQIENYLRLLQLLPERYPLILPGLEEKEVEQWQKSVRIVFNWIAERLQTGLVSRGESVPSCPSSLKLFAYRHGKPDYVSIQDPELVYPDNTFLAQRWESYLAYLRLNDDWRRLRSWLGVRDLTAVVQSEWDPQGELEEETDKLGLTFTETIPYYLALIKQAQPANYDRTVLPRMRRLRLHVVKKLMVKEYVPGLPSLAPLSKEEMVYLEQGDEANPGVGRRLVRAGDLYIAQAALTNLDLLGEHIANYIEIARMGDAFVVLINRNTEGKLRFLQSKGISAEDVIDVYQKWQDNSEEIEGGNQGDSFLKKLLKDRISITTTLHMLPTPVDNTQKQDAPTSSTVQNDESGSEHDAQTGSPVPNRTQYPTLDLDKVTGVRFVEVVATEAQEEKPGHTTGKSKRGGGSGTIVSSEITKELGDRGEEWAYAQEKRRLRDMGFNPEELEEMGELVWLSRQQPMANHDIRSIWVTESGEQRPVYIEVKASVGNGRYIKMSRAEFRLAMHLKEDYWLYWVANIDRAEPDPPVCYRNIAELLVQDKIEIDVDTIAMRLPRFDNQPSQQGEAA